MATTEEQHERSQASGWFALLLIVGGGVLAQLLMAVSGVINARMLGVEGRGQVILLTSVAVTASQLTLGGSLPNAVTKQLAERRVTARDGLRRLAPQWLRWSLVPGALAALYFLFVQRHTDGHEKYALAALTLVMAVQTMASRVMEGAMLGEGTSLVQIALTGVLPQALAVGVLSAAYASGARWNAVELTAVVLICICVVLAARVRVLARPTHREADELDGRSLYRLARRTHIGSVGPIDGLALDRTLVGSLMGSAQLGLYSAAFAVAGLTSILGGCLAMVILPRVTLAQHDPVIERRLVRRWLLVSAVLIGTVVAVLDVGARVIIRSTFGEPFIGAVACAHWLLIAAGLFDFRRVLIAVLQGRDRGGQASMIELALTPVVIIGIVVAARRESLVAVSVAMTVVGVVACLALTVALVGSRPGSRYVPLHAAGPGPRALPPDVLPTPERAVIDL